MERRMKRKFHVRCGGEKLEIISKVYLFRYVDPRLTKPQIRKIFENLFDVTVIAVNSHLLPTRKKRIGLNQGYKTRYKRVIITIKSTQKIPMFNEA
uniref:Large ribosomal subunit protein uL23c n=1 Tax=Ulothrix zonata TaxID=43941 RepID=A0A2Z4MA63_9CHLO|nr:ribosomal protein L23 [Ulothrix zonata]